MQASPGIQSTTFVDHLKRATRDDHEAIEKQVDLSRCATEPQYYVQVLQRFLGFVAPMEGALQEVAGIAAIVPDLSSRMRTGLLQQDLLTLGHDGEDIANLRRCRVLPEVCSVAQALGYLYVMEGSTLGGQIIARRIQEAGVVSPLACAFFRSHGAQVGPMWKRFSAALETYAERHPIDADTICTAARRTFRDLGAWFAESEESQLRDLHG